MYRFIQNKSLGKIVKKFLYIILILTFLFVVMLLTRSWGSKLIYQPFDADLKISKELIAIDSLKKIDKKLTTSIRAFS